MLRSWTCGLEKTEDALVIISRMCRWERWRLEHQRKCTVLERNFLTFLSSPSCMVFIYFCSTSCSLSLWTCVRAGNNSSEFSSVLRFLPTTRWMHCSCSQPCSGSQDVGQKAARFPRQSGQLMQLAESLLPSRPPGQDSVFSVVLGILVFSTPTRVFHNSLRPALGGFSRPKFQALSHLSHKPVPNPWKSCG